VPDRRPPPAPVVLVVEDEPLLRLFAAETIADAGFQVVEAANATEAVHILETRFDIRIVFTDIDMPHGVDGLELAASIRRRWPPIEIVITSGKPFPRGSQLPSRSVFHPKPYRQDQIVATLHRLAA
jgi:CheY-like chemotaxis protein